MTHRSLSIDEAADVATRVAQLSKAGLPLPEGLRAAAAELPARTAAALRDLAGELEAGRSLDQALAALGNRVPASLRGLVLAGLRSGQLGPMLQFYVRQHRQSQSLRRQAWLALPYPGMLLALVAGIVMFFAFSVATGIAELHRDFGTELPPQSQLLHLIAEVRWQIPAAIAACLLLLLMLDQFMSGGRGWRTVVSFLPIVGPLSRWLSMANLCRLLSLLVQQHVPLPEALRLSGGALQDPLLRRDVQRMADRVAAGHSVADAAWHTRLPPTFTALAGWGQDTAVLAESLTIAADLYQRQAEEELKLLKAAVPALSFVAVLLAVSFLIASTMMPLIKIVETLT